MSANRFIIAPDYLHVQHRCGRGTAIPKHFGAALFLQDRVGRWTFSSLNASTAGALTSAHGLGYDTFGFHVNASTGLISGETYANADLIKVWNHANFSANHNSYFSPYALTVDGIGGGAHTSEIQSVHISRMSRDATCAG